MNTHSLAARAAPRAFGLSLGLSLGLVLLLAAAPGALAQQASPVKGSAAHIGAVTKKVDGAFVRSNARATPDWPSHGPVSYTHLTLPTTERV